MAYTQEETQASCTLTPATNAELAQSKYYNADLMPTSREQRNWKTYNIAALWIGMAISIPALALASSLIAMGVAPVWAILNVALGNLLVLIPIQLNSRIGTRYGLPFPVFSRLTFGPRGAQVPSLLRSLVACGWTAVQSWVGGGAVAALLGTFIPFFRDQSLTVALPGNGAVPVGQLIGMLLFMAFITWIAICGIDRIQWVQNIGSPILMVLMAALLIWSIRLAGGAGYSLGDLLTTGTDEALVSQNGGILYVFLAGLTGSISYWATMALNIPDFSRYASSQKAQSRGQLYGMPGPMILCAFVGAVYASATRAAYGTADFDPTTVLYHVQNPFVVALASIGVIIATATTCVAANVVAPANGFSNISPKKITYKMGVWMTILLAILAFQPWWIYGSGSSYVFTWLNNYGAILAPIAAIFIADYFLCKKGRIDVRSLYVGSEGRYWYRGGWNIAAIVAWVLAFIIPLAGNTVMLYTPAIGAPRLIDWLAANGYLVSFAIGFLVYWLLMRHDPTAMSQAEYDGITKKL